MKVREFPFKPSSPFPKSMFHQVLIADVQQVENVKLKGALDVFTFCNNSNECRHCSSNATISPSRIQRFTRSL